MRLVGLISGGKDSLFNMLQCVAAGHDIVAIANIEPETKEELDSFMYQSVGQELITIIGGALGLPVFRHKTKGKALCTSKVYIKTPNDEVEDLFHLLSKVKKEARVDGVAVGAIASDYQRTRVESVCTRLGLKCFAYLWRRNQAELLEEMINAEVDAIIVKVACIGLNSKHLGMSIRDIQPHLIELNKKYGVHFCGEGGEYETMTLDCPLFHRSITITDSEKVVLSSDPFAPAACLVVKKASLNVKSWESSGKTISDSERISLIRDTIRNPYNYVQDCFDELSEAMFPQNQRKRAVEDSLPFPFENLDALDREPGSTVPEVREYWKQPSLIRPLSNLKLASSRVGLTDTSAMNLHFSSGWCCIGNVTGTTVTDALQFVQKHLQRMNYNFQEVVFVNLYVRDLSDFNNINVAYSEFMPESQPPARACVEIPLPPDIGAMLIVVAHKLVSKCKRAVGTSSVEREAMHVQSISHWAPANIGPYSQCVRVSGVYYLSGQIPLIPGTMEVLNKPILHQCKLSLRHVLRILQAMDEKLNFLNVLQAICYVTAEELASDVYSQWLYITNATSVPVAVVVVTRLPRKVQLEWEVIACNFKNSIVHEETQILEELYLHLKAYSSEDPFASSIVCKIKYSKKSRSDGKLSQKPLKETKAAIKKCIDILRKDYKSSGLPLCVLKLFFKAYDTLVSAVLTEIIPSFIELKAVPTPIPVVAFDEPDIILIVTGVCT